MSKNPENLISLFQYNESNESNDKSFLDKYPEKIKNLIQTIFTTSETPIYLQNKEFSPNTINQFDPVNKTPNKYRKKQRKPKSSSANNNVLSASELTQLIGAWNEFDIKAYPLAPHVYFTLNTLDPKQFSAYFAAWRQCPIEKISQENMNLQFQRPYTSTLQQLLINEMIICVYENKIEHFQWLMNSIARPIFTPTDDQKSTKKIEGLPCNTSTIRVFETEQNYKQYIQRIPFNSNFSDQTRPYLNQVTLIRLYDFQQGIQIRTAIGKIKQRDDRNKALIISSLEKGNHKILQSLLEADWKISNEDEQYTDLYRALFNACRHGYRLAVELVFKHISLDINRYNAEHKGLIHYAAAGKNKALFKFILDQAPHYYPFLDETNPTYNRYQDPFRVAIDSGEFSLLEVVLKKFYSKYLQIDKRTKTIVDPPLEQLEKLIGYATQLSIKKDSMQPSSLPASLTSVSMIDPPHTNDPIKSIPTSPKETAVENMPLDTEAVSNENILLAKPKSSKSIYTSCLSYLLKLKENKLKQQKEFIESARNGNIALVTKHIKHGIDINCIVDGTTALEAACVTNNYAIVAYLCGRSKIDTNRVNTQNKTALSLAIEHGSNESMLELLNWGVAQSKFLSPGKKYQEYQDVILLCFKYNQHILLNSYLTSLYLGVNEYDEFIVMPKPLGMPLAELDKISQYAIKNKSVLNKDFKEYVVELYHDVVSIYREFYNACALNQAEMLAYFMAYQLDLNTSFPTELEPIETVAHKLLPVKDSSIAAIPQHTNATSQALDLLSVSFSNISDMQSGDTPLIVATRKYSLASVKYLLTCDHLEVNQTNTCGENALAVALQKHDLHIIQALLAQPSINPQLTFDNEENTLSYCIKHEWWDAALLFARHQKVDVNFLRGQDSDKKAIIQFLIQQLAKTTRNKEQIPDAAIQTLTALLNRKDLRIFHLLSNAISDYKESLDVIKFSIDLDFPIGLEYLLKHFWQLEQQHKNTGIACNSENIERLLDYAHLAEKHQSISYLFALQQKTILGIKLFSEQKQSKQADINHNEGIGELDNSIIPSIINLCKFYKISIIDVTSKIQNRRDKHKQLVPPAPSLITLDTTDSTTERVSKSHQFRDFNLKNLLQQITDMVLNIQGKSRTIFRSDSDFFSIGNDACRYIVYSLLEKITAEEECDDGHYSTYQSWRSKWIKETSDGSYIIDQQSGISLQEILALCAYALQDREIFDPESKLSDIAKDKLSLERLTVLFDALLDSARDKNKKDDNELDGRDFYIKEFCDSQDQPVTSAELITLPAPSTLRNYHLYQEYLTEEDYKNYWFFLNGEILDNVTNKYKSLAKNEQKKAIKKSLLEHLQTAKTQCQQDLFEAGYSYFSCCHGIGNRSVEHLQGLHPAVLIYSNVYETALNEIKNFIHGYLKSETFLKDDIGKNLNQYLFKKSLSPFEKKRLDTFKSTIRIKARKHLKDTLGLKPNGRLSPKDLYKTVNTTMNIVFDYYTKDYKHIENFTRHEHAPEKFEQIQLPQSPDSFFAAIFLSARDQNIYPQISSIPQLRIILACLFIDLYFDSERKIEIANHLKNKLSEMNLNSQLFEQHIPRSWLLDIPDKQQKTYLSVLTRSLKSPNHSGKYSPSLLTEKLLESCQEKIPNQRFFKMQLKNLLHSLGYEPENCFRFLIGLLGKAPVTDIEIDLVKLIYSANIQIYNTVFCQDPYLLELKIIGNKISLRNQLNLVRTIPQSTAKNYNALVGINQWNNTSWGAQAIEALQMATPEQQVNFQNYFYANYALIENQTIDGFDWVKIPGDRNCCPNAVLVAAKHARIKLPEISLFVKGAEIHKEIENHLQLRQATVTWMRQQYDAIKLELLTLALEADIKIPRPLIDNTSITKVESMSLIAYEASAYLTQPDAYSLIEEKNSEEFKQIVSFIDESINIKDSDGYKQARYKYEQYEGHRKQYNRQFHTQIGSVEAYLNYINRLDHPMGVHELSAMAHVLNCKIFLHAEATTIPYQVLSPNSAQAEIHIYKLGHHFDFLVKPNTWQGLAKNDPVKLFDQEVTTLRAQLKKEPKLSQRNLTRVPLFNDTPLLFSSTAGNKVPVNSLTTVSLVEDLLQNSTHTSSENSQNQELLIPMLHQFEQTIVPNISQDNEDSPMELETQQTIHKKPNQNCHF